MHEKKKSVDTHKFVMLTAFWTTSPWFILNCMLRIGLPPLADLKIINGCPRICAEISGCPSSLWVSKLSWWVSTLPVGVHAFTLSLILRYRPLPAFFEYFPINRKGFVNGRHACIGGQLEKYFG
jgi:hypothetical protein